jgi:hypothetical protein
VGTVIKAQQFFLTNLFLILVPSLLSSDEGPTSPTHNQHLLGGEESAILTFYTFLYKSIVSDNPRSQCNRSGSCGDIVRCDDVWWILQE